MTYTLTVSAENPNELADLISVISGGSKSVKASSSKQNSTSASNGEVKKEEDEEIKVTKEMVRELTSEKVQAGKTAKVKTLLAKYGAKNAATVPEESFVAYYKDLKAI